MVESRFVPVMVTLVPPPLVPLVVPSDVMVGADTAVYV